MSIETSHSFIVKKHVKSSVADKEPNCKVVLKTSSTDPFQARLEIVSNSERIFNLYPLDETLEVDLRKSSQTKLPTKHDVSPSTE